ncbi:LysR family transcriptional regulator [Alteribacillus sp. HJP-4]|uniref:LysR family transcriptional regulator n=1 Tax=Alteribacillus sp. HJP-4 TaxID=2775394 RepID=UPI0035CD090B
MNMQWIRTFLTAAVYENYFRASEKLYISQPSVTVHIRQLEKELGVPLFEKKGRRVYLTSFGRDFLPHARSILESFESGKSLLDKKRQGYELTLTIAVSPFLASTYLPYWVKQFIRDHKNVEVDIHVIDSEDIPEEIMQGKADVGLARKKHEFPGLHTEKFQEEPLLIVSPHDGGDSESSLPIELEEIIQGSVLLTHNHPDYWEDVLVELKNLHPYFRTMRVSQVHVTKRFIEEGIGFSILPSSAVRRELAEGRMLEVPAGNVKLPSASSYVIWKNESMEGNAFINKLRSLI